MIRVKLTPAPSRSSGPVRIDHRELGELANIEKSRRLEPPEVNANHQVGAARHRQCVWTRCLEVERGGQRCRVQEVHQSRVTVPSMRP